MKKKQPELKNIVNRRARFDYELDEEIVAGLSLTGAEVRAIRDNRVSLKGAFITIRAGGKNGGELWLNNASFSLKNTKFGEQNESIIDTSPKKLLATRSQISQLEKQKKSGMTIVPLRILSSKKYIKIVIAAGKGKKQHDKRETLKRRTADRESAKSMKRF